MTSEREDEYIYSSLTKLVIRSFQLDVEWICTPGIPGKYSFLITKYFFLFFPPLYWDSSAGAYKLRILQKTVFLLSRTHIGILQSTLSNQAYLRTFIQPHAIIADIGAHTGEFATMCEVLLHPHRVFSFEPIQESYNLLTRNKKQDTYNTAIGTTSERMMYVPKETAMASGYSAYLNETSQTVPCTTLDAIRAITELSIVDLLKIDVEGMEYDVLTASKETVRKSRYILLELSIDRPATTTALATLQYLHTIAPNIQLIHIGQVFGDARRTDSADMLFRNTAL